MPRSDGQTVLKTAVLLLCVFPVQTQSHAQQSSKEASASGPFKISARKIRTVKATSSRAEYEVTLNGTVDMDNSMTGHYGNLHVAFQPDVSLEIANSGETMVVNPRVVVNGRRKSSTAVVSGGALKRCSKRFSPTHGTIRRKRC